MPIVPTLVKLRNPSFNPLVSCLVISLGITNMRPQRQRYNYHNVGLGGKLIDAKCSALSKSLPLGTSRSVFHYLLDFLEEIHPVPRIFAGQSFP